MMRAIGAPAPPDRVRLPQDGAPARRARRASSGIALGIVLSNLLARYFGSTFFAVDVGFGVDPTVLARQRRWSACSAPALAALPAIRRGTRVDLREALESTGSAVGGQDAGDRLLRRVRFLPRTMQIGLRSVGRRRRRSLATALIVALAVGNLLAILGLAAAATKATPRELGRPHRGHARLDRRASSSSTSAPRRRSARRPESPRRSRRSSTTSSSPARRPSSGGCRASRSSATGLADGRWFTAAEEQARERVAVIERNLARAPAREVGDRITLATAAGPRRFRIDRDRQQPAGERHRALRPADDAALGARRSRRAPAPTGSRRPRPTTPSSTGP